MKLYSLLVCLVVLVVTSTASAFAATQVATITIYPGDNWVSAPLVPLNPSPESVFAPCISTSTLTRFDAPTETKVTYSPGGFNILIGEGFILHNPTSNTYQCSYTGIPDGVPDSAGKMTDMWISLPGNIDTLDAGGIHWIGQSFNHDTPISACLVTDGYNVWPIAQAVSLGMIDGLWSYLDGATQTEHTAGLASLGAYDTFLRPTRMYYVRTHKDDMALIIPAYPVPEPCSALALLCGIGGLLWRKRNVD